MLAVDQNLWYGELMLYKVHYNDAEDREEIVINEEEELELNKILNLDEFVNSLEDIIEDSNLEEGNEAEDLAEESQEKIIMILHGIQPLKPIK